MIGILRTERGTVRPYDSCKDWGKVHWIWIYDETQCITITRLVRDTRHVA